METMKQEPTQIQLDTFRRQRRNVMLVSLILVFYQTSGVVFKEINIFGNKLELTDPSQISIVLWIVWAYFFWEYFIYYRTVRERFTNFFHDKMDSLIKKKGIELFKKEVIANDKFPVKPPYDFDKPALSGISVTAREWRYYKINIPDITVKNEESGDEHRIRNHSVDIKVPRLFWPAIISFVSVVLTTRWFTEYYLPFFLAVLPILYLIIQATFNVQMKTVGGL